METRRFFLGHRIAGAAGVLAIGTLLGACSKGPAAAEFHSVDITDAGYADHFSLADFDGKTRTLADFEGKLVVIFFGYTQCPDVCPTTMMEMAQVKQALGADGDRMQVLFISLDPERDTPEVLKAYMAAFDPGFIGLVPGSEQELQKVARDFKIFYERVDGSAPDTYTVDHTAASYVYDLKGRLRLFARYGASTQDLVDDFRQLLAGA